MYLNVGVSVCVYVRVRVACTPREILMYHISRNFDLAYNVVPSHSVLYFHSDDETSSNIYAFVEDKQSVLQNATRLVLGESDLTGGRKNHVRYG